MATNKGSGTQISVKGMARVRAILTRISNKATTREQLHMRFAIIALNWINKNFVTEGGLVGGWKPLSPNTLAGRRGGSGRILQNTGQLRASFVPAWSSESARVGSPMAIAAYHEKGTDPYIIRPKKPGGFLAFKVATKTGIKTRQLKGGKTLSLPFAKGRVIFTREVKHPGLPPRRMLPTEAELRPDLLKAAIEYVKEATDLAPAEAEED